MRCWILAAAVTANSTSFASAAPDLSFEELRDLRAKSTAGLSTLLERRNAFEQLMAAMPAFTGSNFTPAVLGGVPGLWAKPTATMQAKRTILFFHGGGFYSGSSVTHQNAAASLAGAAQANVFVVDYRLAPESRYPAQLDDVDSAYRALLKDGIPSCSIAFASDSAGGWLAADLVVRLKSSGVSLPSSLYLMSPILDFKGTTRSMQTKAAIDPVVKPVGVRNANAAAFGNPPSSTEAEALTADLSGFPPTLIQVGSDETLLDDSLSFLEKEAHAGVETRLHVYTGVLHQWQLFPTNFPPSRAALAEGGVFVADHFCK